jgi:pyruvate/2-oxoglutarate dehydrogenase complex dihydrolipoamide dehydrogenase (E3) component
MVNDRGATSVADVWACGDVTGYAGTADAERAGAAAGKALATALSRKA